MDTRGFNLAYRELDEIALTPPAMRQSQRQHC
jgi:hypothetical protein